MPSFPASCRHRPYPRTQRDLSEHWSSRATNRSLRDQSKLEPTPNSNGRGLEVDCGSSGERNFEAAPGRYTLARTVGCGNWGLSIHRPEWVCATNSPQLASRANSEHSRAHGDDDHSTIQRFGLPMSVAEGSTAETSWQEAAKHLGSDVSELVWTRLAGATSWQRWPIQFHLPTRQRDSRVYFSTAPPAGRGRRNQVG